MHDDIIFKKILFKYKIKNKNIYDKLWLVAYFGFRGNIVKILDQPTLYRIIGPNKYYQRVRCSIGRK